MKMDEIFFTVSIQEDMKRREIAEFETFLRDQGVVWISNGMFK
jgi:hypothetical protein